MVRFVILFSLILYTVAKTAGDKDEESVLEPVPYPEPLAYDDDAFLFGGEAGGAVILGRSGDDDEVVWEDEAGDADTVEDLEDVLREREKALFPLGNEREAGDFQLSLAAKEGSEEAKKEGGERSQDEPSGGFVPPLLLVEDEYSGGRKEDPEKYPANEIVLTNRKPDPLCKPCSSVKMAAPAVSGTNRVPHDDRDKFKLECTAPIPRDKALSKRMTVQWQFSSRDGQNCKVAIQDMKKDLEEIPKHEVHTAPIGLCHTLRPLKNDMELFDREIWTALRGDFSEEMQGTYRCTIEYECCQEGLVLLRSVESKSLAVELERVTELYFAHLGGMLAIAILVGILVLVINLNIKTRHKKRREKYRVVHVKPGPSNISVVHELDTSPHDQIYVGKDAELPRPHPC